VDACLAMIMGARQAFSPFMGGIILLSLTSDAER
jgi:hypothetical protein